MMAAVNFYFFKELSAPCSQFLFFIIGWCPENEQ